MYESFFSLRERPFDLTPNPRFLLLTSQHREALSNLQYGVSARKGLTLLIGEAGTGKTTVIRTALNEWDAGGHLMAYVNNPTLTRGEFYESLADSYGLTGEFDGSKTRFLAALTDLVVRRHDAGKLTGLMIDEAQSLSDELLEEVRLLANIETTNVKLFPVVLAGQPELAERLNGASLRQLKQRIALRCTLGPLDVREAAAYISGRIQIAGGSSRNLFTREAVLAIHTHSHGIARVINVICDNVLLSAFADGVRPATRQIVEDVCRDFDLMVKASDEQMESETFAAPQPARAVADAAADGSAQSPSRTRSSGLPATGAASDGTKTESLFGHFNGKRRFSLFNS